MLKIKLIAIIGILSFVAFVFHNSHSFSSSASGDVFEEIAKYKTWARINKELIKVESFSSLQRREPLNGEFQIDGASGGG